MIRNNGVVCKIMGWDSDGTSEHEEWFEGGRWIVYKESVDSVGGFPFLLSLLVLLYSKAIVRLWNLFWFLFLDTHFEFSPATSLSPAPDPARYIRTSPLYTHLIADVLSILPDSLLWFVLVLLWRNWQLYVDLRLLQSRINIFECACIPRTVAGIVTNPVPPLVGYI